MNLRLKKKRSSMDHTALETQHELITVKYIIRQYRIQILVVVDIFERIATIGAGIVQHQPRDDTGTVKCFGTITRRNFVTILQRFKANRTRFIHSIGTVRIIEQANVITRNATTDG